MGWRVLPPMAGSPSRRRFPGSALGVAARAPRNRLDQHVHLAARRHAEQTETEQATKLAHPRIVLAPPAAPRRSDGQPDLVASRKAIDRLQDQIKGESELELANDDGCRLVAVERHQVAAAYLALDLETQFFEEALDRQVEARFQVR